MKGAQEGKTRYTLQIHPFSWCHAGSTVVPVYLDRRGLPYIACVHKIIKDKRGANKKGRQAIDQWRLPEGFMHPSPLPGINNISVIHPDHMDYAEELIHTQKLTAGEAYQRIHKKYQIKHQNHIDNFDSDLRECGARELIEETGLYINPRDLKLVATSSVDCIVHTFLASIESFETASESLTALPMLAPDTHEIDYMDWICISDFSFEFINGELVIQNNGIPMAISYAILIGRALEELWNRQISLCSDKLFSRCRNAI